MEVYIIKMVLKTQNNAAAGHGQGATIAHLLALNPTTSGNQKIWQDTFKSRKVVIYAYFSVTFTSQAQ